jgi:hypothetical protein
MLDMADPSPGRVLRIAVGDWTKVAKRSLPRVFAPLRFVSRREVGGLADGTGPHGLGLSSEQSVFSSDQPNTA